MPITTHYSPDVFTLVPMSSLSKQHFESHPIWSEYYDYDEREEIVAWGVDAQWLTSELERVHTGNDHCAYPILRPYPLPDRMRLYIRAIITLKNRRTLVGYVMNEDAYVLSIFADEEEFCFTRNGVLSELNDKDLKRLSAKIDCSPNDVFPVTYETEFLDSEDKLIAGVFSLAENTR
jgi:hypothetical protein